MPGTRRRPEPVTVYTLIKTTHVACAAATYALFLLRGVWMLNDPVRLRSTWVRVVPHAVDTLLLASALALVVVTGQYPGPQAWLNVKIACLVLYIGLGLAAFRFSKRRTSKLAAWIVAQVVFFYIVSVALTRTPYPL